jgi:adenylylsulfate kinase-like enzyme
MFIEREREMQAIERHFLAEKQAVPYSPTRRKTFLLHGLGGMGKTQLAIAFARRHQQRFSAILWLDGSSIDQLK